MNDTIRPIVLCAVLALTGAASFAADEGATGPADLTPGPAAAAPSAAQRAAVGRLASDLVVHRTRLARLHRLEQLFDHGQRAQPLARARSLLRREHLLHRERLARHRVVLGPELYRAVLERLRERDPLGSPTWAPTGDGVR